MRMLGLSLMSGLLLLATLSAQVPLEPPQPATKKSASLSPTDIHAGRELPSGAIARLGSPRMRVFTEDISGTRTSANGKLVLTYAKSELRWWDVDTGRVIYHHPFERDSERNGVLLEDGTLVAFHPKSEPKVEHYLQRYDPKAGKYGPKIALADLPGYTRTAFDPTGGRFAVAYDGDAKKETPDANANDSRNGRHAAVYDTLTGKKLWQHVFEHDLLAGPEFLNSHLVAVAQGDHFEIYDIRDGKLLKKLPPRQPDSGKNQEEQVGRSSRDSPTIVGSADGKWLAAGYSTSEETVVWNVETGKSVVLPKTREPLRFVPGTKRLIARNSELVSMWDAQSGTRERTLSTYGTSPETVTHDGKRMIFTSDDALIVCEIPEKGEVQFAANSANPPGLPSQIRFDRDGGIVGTMQRWGGWTVWKNRAATPVLVTPPGASVCVSINTDRNRAVVLQKDKLQSIELATNRVLAEFPTDLNESGIRASVGVSSAGTLAVGVTEDGIELFDFAKKQKRTIKSQISMTTGGRIAALSGDGKVAVVDRIQGENIQNQVLEFFTLDAPRSARQIRLRSPADQVVLSHDGHIAVTYHSERTNQFGSAESFCRVLDTVRGLELLQSAKFLVNTDSLLVSISHDGRMVAVGAKDKLNVYETWNGGIRFSLKTTYVGGMGFGRDGRTLAVSGGGWPIAILDLTGVPAFEQSTKPANGEELWTKLNATSSANAYRAARELTLTPQKTVELLRTKLVVTPPVDPIALKGWIDDLDAPAFAVRNDAMKQLRTLGEQAVPELNRVLGKTESVEVRSRIESLVAITAKPTPENIRQSRAIEVLEWLGTTDATELLERLAKGAEGSWQTREAVAALSRRKMNSE